MELELQRTYFSKGTNGVLSMNGQFICYTIELPWQQNIHEISCIPEGRYELQKCINQKFGEHFRVWDVKGRDGILIHPANDAMKELKGCIAPVSKLTGDGQGIESRKALKILVDSLQQVGSIFLTIKSNIYEFNRKSTSADTGHIQEDKKHWDSVSIS